MNDSKALTTMSERPGSALSRWSARIGPNDGALPDFP